MTDEVNSSPRAKLPVIRTVAEGLAALRPAWRRIVALLIVILLIEIALDYFLPFLSALLSGFLSVPIADAVVRILGTLIRTVPYINLLLVTARLVLFAESPSVADLFRWDGRRWRFFWNYLLIALVAAVPLIVGAILTPRLGSLLALPEAILAVQAIYMLCWLWAASWLSLVIPIIASDDPAAAIDKAWRVATGNRFRLLGITACIVGGVLIAIGSGLIFEAFFYVNPLQLGILGYVLATLLVEAVYVAYAAIGAAAYRRLTGATPRTDAI